MRDWKMVLLRYFAVFLLFGFAETKAGEVRRPNIIFILTDDQRYDAMGFMGAYPFLKTPNMDRIREEGVHFKNSYTVLSMCGPSRASILTGTYPQVNGVITNVEGREFDPDKTPSFPQVLQQNGYRTGFLGKWHLDHGNHPRKGFDHWISFSGQGKYKGNTLNINGELVENPGYITDELTNYALEFIKKNADQPFCLYLSHKAVHSPFTPAERHALQYADDPIPHLANFDDDLANKPEWQRVNMGRNELYRSRYNNPLVTRPKVPKGTYDPKVGGSPISKNYLRSISAVDEGIGKIFDLLEKEGLLDNTCIMFAGDNGYLLGEHHRGDKRVAYNEAMRIPLIMRMPGVVEPGSTVEEMVLNVDIAPTLLDLAGVEAPEIMQGKSVLPLFDADVKTPWRDSFLFTYWQDLIPSLPRIVSVRDERFVYSTYPDIDDLDELYDLEKDPQEMTNLANLPEYAPVLKEMQAKMEKLKEESGYKKLVPRPQPEPDWGVLEGFICDVDFNVKSLSEIKDASSVGNHPKLFGGKLVKGIEGSALSFDGDTTVSFPWNKQVTPEKGSYVVEVLVRSDADGVIAAQGNEHRGIMVYVDDGCPGLVLKEAGHRLQFLDSQKSFTGQWVQIVAQVRNYHNRMSLWVNGELVAEEQILWPIHDMHKAIGGLTLGSDPSGKIDPLEISPLRFEGDIQYFRIHRQADVKNILSKARALGLSFETGNPRN